MRKDVGKKDPENDVPKALFDIIRFSPEIVLFFVTLGNHIAAASAHFYIYKHFSDKRNFPFEYRNKHRVCSSNLNSTQKKLQGLVQSDMSHFEIANIYCGLVPSVLAILFLGPLSDRIGRRPVLKISVVTMIVSKVLHLWIMTFKKDMYWFYVASFVGSIGGGESGIRIPATAYLIDLCDDRTKLAFKLAVIQGVEIAASMLSSFIGGPYVQSQGFKIPVVTGMVLMLIAFVYLVALLKPSNHHRNGTKFKATDEELKVSEFLLQPLQIFNVAFRKRERRTELWFILIAFMIILESTHAYASGYHLVLLSSPFCMPPNLLSYYHGTQQILHIVGLLFSTKVLLKHIHWLTLSIFSLLVGTMNKYTIVFINSSTMVFAFMPLLLFMGWYSPILRTFLSEIVSDNEQGTMLSFISCIGTILNTLVKSIFLMLYAYLQKRGKYRWYFMMTSPIALLAIPFLCVFWQLNKRREEKQPAKLCTTGT